MGTRGVIRVFDSGPEGDRPELVTIYRQFDGYPEALGLELRQIVDGRRIVNGIPGGVGRESKAIANGMGCLAATIVASLKSEVGSVYLYPPGTQDCGQAYEYHVVHEGEVTSGAEKSAKVFAFECRGGYDGVPRTLEKVAVPVSR